MIDLSNVAARLLADEPALLTSLDFGPFVRQGTGSGPSLLIGDVSEINLMRPGRTSRLDHRMAHLAHAGDVVLVRERDPVFEGYLQEFCTLKDIEFFGTDPTCDDGVAKQALTSAPLFDHLVDVTRKNGGLTIQPYLTTETIWHLAKAIGERANCIVNVSGPSSRISLRANDKLWFVQLARTVIGNDAVPPTISAYGPMASAALIQWFSTQGKQVIVKVPDSAGSAGNIRLDPEILENLSTDEIEALLIERLHGTGWADTYPILVGVWDSNVSCTPSVQMWIPHISEGQPTVQGVFEQRVFGPTAAFVGAIKSRQPATLQHALAD
ncbi:MAG: hypothetical protein OTI35_09080, partial [Sulfitobacter sp.]|nr:hypothetical protein [Sulfitobacter sp.]